MLVIADIARQLRDGHPPDAATNSNAHAALAVLIESAEFMQSIITELLELGALRDQQLRVIKQPTDFSAIVRQALARNTPYARSKRCELRMEFVRELPNIRADDRRIMQVLENLIGNAIKFSPPGSVTTVHTTRGDASIMCAERRASPSIFSCLIPRLSACVMALTPLGVRAGAC